MADVAAKATLGLLIFLVGCPAGSIFGLKQFSQNVRQYGSLQILWNIIILGIAGATLSQVSDSTVLSTCSSKSTSDFAECP